MPESKELNTIVAIYDRKMEYEIIECRGVREEYGSAKTVVGGERDGEFLEGCTAVCDVSRMSLFVPKAYTQRKTKGKAFTMPHGNGEAEAEAFAVLLLASAENEVDAKFLAPLAADQAKKALTAMEAIRKLSPFVSAAIIDGRVAEIRVHDLCDDGTYSEYVGGLTQAEKEEIADFFGSASR